MKWPYFLCYTLFITNIHANHPISPEIESVWTPKPLVHGKHFMVVTNNIWASKAAKQILAQGGNAVDAAIAATFVLGVTEPQSSGLGGGGYALTYQHNKQTLHTYDGRERAPSSANPAWFLNAKGKPLDFTTAMLSPKAVGIPGEVAMLYLMHQQEGHLSWKKLLTPAIIRASHGYRMTPRLWHLLTHDRLILLKDKQAKAIYFTKNGQVKPLGTLVKNQVLANTLRLIADAPQAFYQGKIAQDIVNTLNQASNIPLYQLSDFSGYSATRGEALCDRFRHYRICTVPPSAGGLAVLELLKLYAARFSGQSFQNSQWAYTFLEAAKLMFADRNQYLADPAFVKQPVMGLLQETYITHRSALITNNALQGEVAPGLPIGAEHIYGADTHIRLHGTSSLSIVDANDNAVAMTVTIEHQFGNHRMVDGFFLNNELTDFSFIPKDKEGRWIANRVEAYKRPRSSMSPVMVFHPQKHLQVIAASPGGNVILCYVAKNIIQMLDFDWDPAKSAASGNLCVIHQTPMIEANSDLIPFVKTLQKQGESIAITHQFTSGETNIKRCPQHGWWGAADPRREGEALGG